MPHVVGDFLKALNNSLAGVVPSVVLLDPHARQILEQFRRAGALSPETAQSFHPQSPPELHAFEQLLRLTVVRQPRPGRYFLDSRTLRRLTVW